MKKRPLLFLTSSFIIASLLFIADKEKAYTPRNSDNTVTGYAGAVEYFKNLRANPETGEFDSEVYQSVKNADQNLRAQKSTSTIGVEWQDAGPDNIGGRTKAILIYEGNTMFAGGTTGGLFKSMDMANTWEKVTSFDAHYGISSICALGNGHIYVATGSSHEQASGSPSAYGGGLFVSTDGGDTWDYALDNDGNPIKPDSFTNSDYGIIDEVRAHPLNDDELWVASNVGLELYKEGTGFMPYSSGLPESICESFDISSDGMVIAASMGSSNLHLSFDGGETFEDRAGSGVGEIPSSVSRLDVAISKDDPDFIYGIVAEGSPGSFGGVYGSSDQGDTFELIWPGDVPEVNIDRPNNAFPTAWYALDIAVVPGSPGMIIVGALDVWVGGFTAQPEQVSTWTLNAGVPGGTGWNTAIPFPLDNTGNGFGSWVHADIQQFVFDDDGTLFIGTDGGIFRSEDGANSFTHCNRFYNQTQYYGIAYSANDKILGGTQDNGTLYITKDMSTSEEAYSTLGGDGTQADVSSLDPTGNVIFNTIVNGLVFRSNFGGFEGANFYCGPEEMVNQGGPWVTPIRLWESDEADNPYMVDYKNETDEVIPAGTEIQLESRCWGYTFTETLTDDLGAFESVDFPDPATTLFAVGYSGTGSVWVTREATYFDTYPQYAKVITTVGGGDVTALEWSKENGNDLWIGTSNGALWRVSGFKDAFTVDEMSVDSVEYMLSPINVPTPTSGAITDISVDPNDPDHVLISRGGFGGSAKVQECTNGTSDDPTFVDVWFDSGDPLAALPAYSCLIEASNPEVFIVGTEFGVYATDNGGADWYNETTGPLGPVIVTDIRQQWRSEEDVENAGVIYLGTYGQGALRSTSFEKAHIDVADGVQNAELISDLKIRPNPMSEYGWLSFTSEEEAQIDMDIYSMNGQRVKSMRIQMNEGSNEVQFDVSDLYDGTYVIQLRKDDKITTDKIIIIK